MKAYKLTDGNDRTYGGCQWGVNITHETSGEGELCNRGWLHFYDDPLLAVLLNPIHADFYPTTMHMWEAEAQGEIKSDNGLKFGCTRLITLDRLAVPDVTLTQRVAFAILCAKHVYGNPDWAKWADGWLSGADRSGDAAWDAARDAGAAWNAARNAARAAEASADAAWDAARAAEASADAAWDAAGAAGAAGAAAGDIDLKAIAQEAMKY